MVGSATGENLGVEREAGLAWLRATPGCVSFDCTIVGVAPAAMRTPFTNGHRGPPSPRDAWVDAGRRGHERVLVSVHRPSAAPDQPCRAAPPAQAARGWASPSRCRSDVDPGCHGRGPPSPRVTHRLRLSGRRPPGAARVSPPLGGAAPRPPMKKGPVAGASKAIALEDQPSCLPLALRGAWAGVGRSPPLTDTSVTLPPMR